MPQRLLPEVPSRHPARRSNSCEDSVCKKSNPCENSVFVGYRDTRPSRCLANPHCRIMRNELQCGDKLVPSPRSIILGVWLGNTHPTPESIILEIAASAKPSTGGFRHWRVSCLSSWRRSNLERPVQVMASTSVQLV